MFGYLIVSVFSAFIGAYSMHRMTRTRRKILARRKRDEADDVRNAE